MNEPGHGPGGIALLHADRRGVAVREHSAVGAALHGAVALPGAVAAWLVAEVEDSRRGGASLERDPADAQDIGEVHGVEARERAVRIGDKHAGVERVLNAE